MATNGIYGFRIDGQDKLTYNHNDSYPDGLGVSLVDQVNRLLESKGIEALRQKARAIKLVDEDSTPTEEEIKLLEPFKDIGVSKQTPNDWYCLMRNAQGDLGAHLDSGYMIEGSDFIKRSLFCEYAYIVNLDDEVLELYLGFQKEPHSDGRYAGYQPEEHVPGMPPYYACRLIASIPFGPGLTRETLLEVFTSAEEELYAHQYK